MRETIELVDRPPVGRRSLRAVSVLVVVVSSIVSALAASVVPSQMRIHWSLGGTYYGPEFAPAWLLLGMFPLVVAALAVGSHHLKRYLEASGEYDVMRGYYELAVLGVLATLLLVQGVLILLNL